MKIVHLSTSDMNGGAARAAYRLHLGLIRLGHDSTMFVARRRGNDPRVIAFAPAMNIYSRLRRRLRREQITRSFLNYRRSRPAGYELFSDDRTEHGSAILQQLPPCDVINLHWIAGFVDYEAFFVSLPEQTPVIWTLHDMNPFTGGCHYDHGCGKFRANCGSCPQLGSRNEDDLSRRIWYRKRDIFSTIRELRLHLVADSRWLATEARCSALLGRFPVTSCYYGLDVEDFAPRDRSFARDVLGVPRDVSVVLFAAHSVENRRKGFALLIDALAGMSDPKNPFLISVGSGKPAIDARISHLHLGHISDDRWLSLVYSAADVFVIPSLQEAFGQTFHGMFPLLV